jgi:hypothetical protein
VREEAVFSSTGDRIRASQSSFAGAGLSVVPRRTSTWAGRAAESLFAVLFPTDSRICAAPLVRVSRLPACSKCPEQILPVHGPLRSDCGERRRSPHVVAESGGQPLGPVGRHVEPQLSKAVAYSNSQGGLRELIHSTRGLREGAGPASSPVRVVAVPLHRSRGRRRAFNHAELLARAEPKLLAADRLGLRNEMVLGERSGKKTRDPITDGLTIRQRQENVRGALAVRRAQEVNGREVLLVDDVYTTSATVSEPGYCAARERLKCG